MSLLSTWKRQARHLREEGHALYLAYRDPRVPWYARVVAALAVGYLFSPIDLIPDFIPVIGYLDDLLIVPLLIMLARRLIPPDVMAEQRAAARAASQASRPTKWFAAVIIVLIWLLLAAGAIVFVLRVIL